jgi:hypothetical protein
MIENNNFSLNKNNIRKKYKDLAFFKKINLESKFPKIDEVCNEKNKNIRDEIYKLKYNKPLPLLKKLNRSKSPSSQFRNKASILFNIKHNLFKQKKNLIDLKNNNNNINENINENNNENNNENLNNNLNKNPETEDLLLYKLSSIHNQDQNILNKLSSDFLPSNKIFITNANNIIDNRNNNISFNKYPTLETSQFISSRCSSSGSINSSLIQNKMNIENRLSQLEDFSKGSYKNIFTEANIERDYEKKMIKKSKETLDKFNSKINLNYESTDFIKKMQYKNDLNMKFNQYFDKLISQNKSFDYITMLKLLKEHTKKKEMLKKVKMEAIEKQRNKFLNILEKNNAEANKFYMHLGIPRPTLILNEDNYIIGSTIKKNVRYNSDF